jgi:ribosomal protein S18 acetylase RimI-like enzyme
MPNIIKLDADTAKTIGTGLFKTQGTYKVVELSEDHIKTMLDFQKLIVRNLKAEEEAFYLEKSESFLTAHFNAGSKAVGIICNDKLLGQALLVHPTAQFPNTGMTDMSLNDPVESISVIQGLGVHPDARGLSIGSKLIDAWLDVAKTDGRNNVIAETEQHNQYSWQLFLDHDIQIVGQATDPSDGAKLYNHHKVLTL